MMKRANLHCFVPQSSEEKKSYQAQIHQKITSNILEINFDRFKKQSEDFIEKTPIFCINCQAVLNQLSKVKLIDNNQIWQCEFCDYENPLQGDQTNSHKIQDDIFYMLERKKENQNESNQNTKSQENFMEENTKEEKDFDDERTVIFCLDNSGSMSSGTVFKDEDGTSKYMSRKQCVEKAIHSQIIHMQNKYPNRKVGIVLFSKDVIILGDCQSAGVTISKDGTFEKLFELGQNHYQNMFQNKVQHVHNMSQKYKETRTSGSTALGPGLAISLGLASQSTQSGPSILLFTDGLANEGIGKLEDQKDYATYEKMGLLAKSQGILINTITMRGNESDVRILGKLSDTTGGRTSRVGPADFNANFVELINTDLVATKVEIVVQLHEGLTLIDGSPHTDFGNATENSSISFQYAVKDNYDFKGRTSIPIQCKIFFTTLQGHKMARIITQSQNITYEKQQANQNVEIEVLARHANKLNAQEALFGSLEKAEKQNAMWNGYIQNDIYSHNLQQELNYNKYVQESKKFDGAVQKKKVHNQLSNLNNDEVDDLDQELYDLF